MIAIIDYDAGNTCSVMNAMKRLDATYVLTDNAEVIRGADKVIFPGVGHATQAMNSLRDKNLVEVIKAVTQPLLGICVGMQLLNRFSVEGDTPCLGIFDSMVEKFVPLPAESFQKVPHMGWNQITKLNSNLFTNIDEDAFVYFVHSYYVAKNDYTIATSDYNHPFSAAIQKENFYGLQYHVEKSGAIGEKILSNFLSL